MKAQRLSWFGYINGLPETSTLKRIHKWKPFTGRPAGRPKSRWEGDVRNGLKKMKLMKWAEQVQDRLNWKDIVDKTKTVQSFSAIVEEEEVFSVIHPVVFCILKHKRKYNVKYKTLKPYNYALHVSVHLNHHRAPFYTNV